jgi:hypothetical protein
MRKWLLAVSYWLLALIFIRFYAAVRHESLGESLLIFAAYSGSCYAFLLTANYANHR